MVSRLKKAEGNKPSFWSFATVFDIWKFNPFRSSNLQAQLDAWPHNPRSYVSAIVRRLLRWMDFSQLELNMVHPPSEVDTLSDAEILSLCDTAPNICPPECRVGPMSATILRISNDTVVKWAWDMDFSEARTMELVRSKTSIPVPAVRRLIQGENGGHLAMAYIEGQTLLKCWGDLSWWRRLRVGWTLRGYVQQLRQVRTKEVETPGPVGDTSSLCIGRFFTEDGAGPFATYAEMSAWYAGRLAVTQRQPWADPSVITNPPIFDDSKPLVLTHQDLSMRNIILGQDGKLWLIDWAWAGYYPPWFEYAGMDYYVIEKFPKSFLRMIPFIAGFHRRKMGFFGMNAWSLTTGRRIKP